ncbi:hypothetical protein Anapl_17414 [Anas platyrhynchos]|uniref:Uncharacterized protein n=1 Tax=Anas platyrhynchos TaxID=8839 RepID=R0J8B2_ANAPL|nr:hypothetical protein Anapl_17414 [Anas platyrhynchos]
MTLPRRGTAGSIDLWGHGTEVTVSSVQGPRHQYWWYWDQYGCPGTSTAPTGTSTWAPALVLVVLGPVWELQHQY